MEELFSSHGWLVTLESAPLPDGRTKTGVRIHRADAAHIIAVPSPGRVLLIREFRPFYGQYIWMLPSGKADKEDDIVAAAQRELREETGFEAMSVEHFSTVNHTDALTFSNHIFIATDLRKNPLPQDPDELIEVHDLPVDEALENVLTSPKVHLASAYALLRYLRDRS